MKQVNVPSALIPDKYPHFMQRDSSCSYHSTSILGEIYDQLEEFQSNARTVGGKHPFYSRYFSHRSKGQSGLFIIECVHIEYIYISLDFAQFL